MRGALFAKLPPRRPCQGSLRLRLQRSAAACSKLPKITSTVATRTEMPTSLTRQLCLSTPHPWHPQLLISLPRPVDPKVLGAGSPLRLSLQPPPSPTVRVQPHGGRLRPQLTKPCRRPFKVARVRFCHRLLEAAQVQSCHHHRRLHSQLTKPAACSDRSELPKSIQ